MIRLITAVSSLLCVVNIQVLACSPHPGIVDLECGVNGVTYQNAGFRFCASYPWGSIGLACKGPCPCPPTSCVPPCNGTIVNCFVDPCMFSTPCEAQQGLECVADYCDGCNARYYDDNCNEVKCGPPPPQDCLPTCDNPVNCFVDPCQFDTPCAAQAGLECVSDYCGGCFARYYDDNCNEVKCGTNPQSCLPRCTGTIVQCFVDPCVVAQPCAAQANLTCVSDYCDGCNARFYDDNCNEVKCDAAS